MRNEKITPAGKEICGENNRDVKEVRENIGYPEHEPVAVQDQDNEGNCGNKCSEYSRIFLQVTQE